MSGILAVKNEMGAIVGTTAACLFTDKKKTFHNIHAFLESHEFPCVLEWEEKPGIQAVMIVC